MATNRNTLSQSFKKVIGISVFAWLRIQRMKQAEILLRTTNKTIQQISFEVGYNDPANFSTSYRQLFKISPQQFRKNALIKISNDVTKG